MTTLIVLDTETTGLPEWQLPSDDPVQPHLTQLGAILYDLEKRETKGSFDLLIRPDGWEIPQEVTDLNGITTEDAAKFGVSESYAVGMLLHLFEKADLRIAHNKTFDQRIIRIALKRYFGEEIQERWAEKDDFLCTMQLSKPILQLEGKRGFKNPTLQEAYKHFYGVEFEGAHTAMADAQACLDVYLKILEQG